MSEVLSEIKIGARIIEPVVKTFISYWANFKKTPINVPKKVAINTNKIATVCLFIIFLYL